MKKLFIICLSILFLNNANAQENSELKFETNFYDAINKWVVLPKKDNDSLYTYGFIYIDISAGITFHLGGSFFIDKNNKYIGDAEPGHQMTKKRLGF